jgi:hypothetical protein
MAVMSDPSLSSFLEALRSTEVLEPGQWHQVQQYLEGGSPSTAELARDLVRRGWLTAYQANQLNRGHGSDLVIGPYVLLDHLGGGGMGEVYRARHRHIRTRLVALKVIREDRLGNSQMAAQVIGRFQREPEAMARLSHPNIATVHDAGNDNSRLYLVMEHLEGKQSVNPPARTRPWTQHLVWRSFLPRHSPTGTAGHDVSGGHFGSTSPRSDAPDICHKARFSADSFHGR